LAHPDFITQSSLGMAESSFSSNESKSFIHVSRDNRIQLWDTDTRREKLSYVERNNLAHSYTCSAWRCGKNDKLGYFAVGTSDGTVVIWDLARGIVSKTIGRANDSPVPTSIAFANDVKSIFVSSAQDNHINQYDLSTGNVIKSIKAGKKGVLKVAMNQKADVIAAGG
jgi:WD40 repeat protein